MKVLVTGGRNYPFKDRVWRLLDLIAGVSQWRETQDKLLPADGFVLVHGAYPGGADRWADQWAICNWVKTEEFPVSPEQWRIKGLTAGPMRNQEMVDTKPDICVAFPSPGSKNLGTQDCMRRARAAGIMVLEVS